MTGITGVLGGTWRADVTPWGAVVPWDGSPPLDWHVAADDRWHTPAEETAVRQVRRAGAPVFETRARVPGGDAVHRVWSVAEGGGWTVIEVANDSPLPFACAFTRRDVVTSRPPVDVPIEGIDLPPGTVVVPVGHRAAVTVGLPHSAGAEGGLLRRLPAPDSVIRGWVRLAERASRLVLPDPTLADAVVAARCDLLLAGLPEPREDPVAFLLATGELARLGELDDGTAADLAPEIGWSVERIARASGWDVDAALDAAALALYRAGELRAVADVARITAARRGPAPPPASAVAGIRTVPAVERRLARGPELFPDGIPAAWHGTSIEAHGLAVGPATTLSFAVRWHGPRPAVLWEMEGDPVELTAPAVDPAWRTRASSGEALWRGGPS